MSALNQTIRQLQDRKTRAQQEIEKLNLAINALRQLDGNAIASTTANPKRTLSVAARRKIAAAQKARWAKIRAGKK